MRVVGALFLAVGLGFLTSAAWITLVEAYSPLFAALILAGIFLGLGLVILGVASGKNEDEPAQSRHLQKPDEPPEPGSMSPLAEAFIIGLNAAHAMRGKK